MPTLNWMGKEKVVNHHNDVPYKVLEQKYNFDSEGQHEDGNGSENMIIHGDNLEALKSLLPKYEGRVKCIYIDPPYNTGEEKWVYNDNVNDPRIKKWLGEVVGKEGEDFSRHDKWLCMMYPRLKLLQKLLSDDGAIFISIDDNEQASLKFLCDEIFGANNFLANFIWEKRKNRENRKEISSRHDYILSYAKNKFREGKTLSQLPMTGESLSRYTNPDNDPRGPWKSDPATAQSGHATESQFYDLILDNGVVHKLPAGRCWIYTEEVMKKYIADNMIWLGKDGKNVPRKKTYLYEKERGLTPESMWFADDVSTNERAKNELKSIFPEDIPFPTPKPHELIEQIIKLCLGKNDIILDSFAGSGTTAHAVLNMNKADGGNRKFILIEMEDYADTITAERVKRVIHGYGEDKKKVEGTGGDFSYYELGEPIFKDNLLNTAVSVEKIREYVYYMETKKLLENPIDMDEPYFMAIHDTTAYYFFYEHEEETVLDFESLNLNVKQKAESYVIYADSLLLDEEFLARYNITFKKIPRDIARL